MLRAVSEIQNEPVIAPHPKSDHFQGQENNNLPVVLSPGITKTKVEIVDQKKLEYQRLGRIGATTSAVVLNTWAIFGLFNSAIKLIKSSFGNGSQDEAYEALGKAYTKSSIAGALTGIAQESSPWALGNAGMGLFSSLGLDKIENLAGFSFADGLAAIGMGQVRYRDEQNPFAIEHSIFNSPKLSALKFLIPVEQAVISFFQRFTSRTGWKSFGNREPYELFKTAGGGLIAAGGLLGITSLFKNKISEAAKSFAYIPYSLFSMVNLIALYRDGKVVLDRTKDFGGRKQSETNSMLVEGYSKKIAAPILGLNNFLLALKGIGIDSQGSLVYNLAMATRAIGAGVAFIAFTAQSALKYFIPDLFGPKSKRIVEIILNPRQAIEEIKKFLSEIKEGKNHRELPHQSDKFDNIINLDNTAQVINLLSKSNEIQSLINKSQAGLPHPQSIERAFLERYTHSRRVCAISIILSNALLKNTKDTNLRTFLGENELALKLAGLLHDVGHTWRSHIAENAIKGHNNDELTIKILKKRDGSSDIYTKLMEHFASMTGEEEARIFTSDLLEKITEIIGHKSCLSKILKMADFCEYVSSKGGDFNITDPDEFQHSTIGEITHFAQGIQLYTDAQGKPQVGFTEDGAISMIELLHKRYRFNMKFNTSENIIPWDMTYILGLDAADLSIKDVMKMRSEDELDQAAFLGINKLNGNKFDFEISNTFGGEKAYTGLNLRNTPTVIDSNGNATPFIQYFETVIKENNPQEYQRLLPMVNDLRIPKELKLKIHISTHNGGTQNQVRTSF